MGKNQIGKHNDVSYYLLFKGYNKNTLTRDFVKNLDKNGKKVIYADKCIVDERSLDNYNIEFKQIPYEIRVY